MLAHGDIGHRILAVTKSLQRGGAEVLLVEQVRSLRRLGHDVDVVYDAEHRGPIADELVAIGCRVVGYSNLHLRPLALRSHLSDYYCIVHTHSPLPAATARFVSLTVGRRVGIVHTEHSLWPAHHPFTRWANRFSFPLVDRAIAVSQVVERSMSEAARCRTTAIHHGIDADAVSQRGQEGSGRLRDVLGLPFDAPLIGTIANLRPEKDYSNLLGAAARILERRPKTVFVSIGYGSLMPEVHKLAEELGIAGSVHLLGRRDDALELIADVDVFVLASRSEGLPVALMEAMALSLPIVATDAGGIPELLRHEETGLCVPTRAPHRLADAVLSLLEDPVRASRLAARAREVIEEAAPSKVAREILEIYDEMCPVHGSL